MALVKIVGVCGSEKLPWLVGSSSWDTPPIRCRKNIRAFPTCGDGVLRPTLWYSWMRANIARLVDAILTSTSMTVISTSSGNEWPCRAHADCYILTDSLTPDEVSAQVVERLTELGFPPQVDE